MGGRNHLLCDHLLLLWSHATRRKMTSVAVEEVLPTNQSIKKGKATSCLITHLTVSIKFFFFCLHGNSIALLLLILEGLCSQACVSGSATTGLGIHQCVTSLKHHLCWHYIMIYGLFRVLTAIRNPWASSASGQHPAIEQNTHQRLTNPYGSNHRELYANILKPDFSKVLWSQQGKHTPGN